MTPGEPLCLAPDVIVAGKYRLVAPLARGGMGSVWTATHVELGVPVAIKFIDPQHASAEMARLRFAREAKSAAALHNRHIVAIRDYGVDRDTPYLVMELLTGEALAARLRREGRLSLAATSTILGQIARALRGAHEAGLVHRDLKPGNVFLARIDDEEVVKVLDFGIAKDTSATTLGDATGTGELIGSPHYMSPEQVRGSRDLDSRSDIWSLGVIVFRCLTGQLPFPGETLGDVIAKIVSDPVPEATEVAPDLPPAVDGFLARAMARDRAARFPAVRDMAAALAAIASGPPAVPIAAAALAGAVSAASPDEGPTRLRPDSGPMLAPPEPPTHLRTGSGPMLAPPEPPTHLRTGSGPMLAPPEPPTWTSLPGEATAGTLGGAGHTTAPRVKKARTRAAGAVMLALIAGAAAAMILGLRRPAVLLAVPAATTTASPAVAAALPPPGPVTTGAPAAPDPGPVQAPAEAPPADAPALPAPAPSASARAPARASSSASTRLAAPPRRALPAKQSGLPAVGF